MRRRPDDQRGGEAERRRGVRTAVLRGSAVHPERNSSGHRRYSRSVLRLVAFIVFAQKVGLSLDEIRAELAKLPKHRMPRARRLGEAVGRMAKPDHRASRNSNVSTQV